MTTIAQLQLKILRFRDQRDWRQFHSPRNLAAALNIEAGELQELLLWKTDEEIQILLRKGKFRDQFASEIADVLIYGLLLSEAAGIAPQAAIERKLKINREKYPVRLAKGNATKYTELQTSAKRRERKRVGKGTGAKKNR